MKGVVVLMATNYGLLLLEVTVVRAMVCSLSEAMVLMAMVYWYRTLWSNDYGLQVLDVMVVRAMVCWC